MIVIIYLFKQLLCKWMRLEEKRREKKITFDNLNDNIYIKKKKLNKQKLFNNNNNNRNSYILFNYLRMKKN